MIDPADGRPADRPQSIAEFRTLLGLADRRQRPRPTLPTLAPELTEWAGFFAVAAGERVAIEREGRSVTARAADDLVRQAETFVGIVQDLLGVPPVVALPEYLTPVAPARRHTDLAG